MSEPRPSPWIRPGWYVAGCLDCTPVTLHPFEYRTDRDAWADQHVADTGHDVERLDGENESDLA